MFRHLPQGDEIKDAEQGRDGNEKDVRPGDLKTEEMVEEDVVGSIVEEMESHGDDRGVEVNREIPASQGEQEDEAFLQEAHLHRIRKGPRVKENVGMASAEQRGA